LTSIAVVLVLISSTTGSGLKHSHLHAKYGGCVEAATVSVVASLFLALQELCGLLVHLHFKHLQYGSGWGGPVPLRPVLPVLQLVESSSNCTRSQTHATRGQL
jgi:hypothetical protein